MSSTPPTAPHAPVPLMVRASDLKHRPITWLWPNRIARAKLTLIADGPGSGKSALAASIIATATTGGTYPCGEGSAAKGSVILINPGADPDVLVPRLKAAGADLARVRLISEMPAAKGPRPFDVAIDLPSLDAVVRATADLRLIVVDALNLPTGRRAREATSALFETLAKFADAHEIAVVALVQPAGTGRTPRKAVALDALTLSPVRAAFVIEVDPTDETRRVLLQVKNELAPTPRMLAFRVKPQETDSGQSAARIAFEQQHHPLSQREFTVRQSRGFNSAKMEAIEFLRSLVGSKTQLNIRHVEQEARAVGLVGANQALIQSRILREARMAMGLVVTRDATGAWVLAKPGPAQPQPTQPGLTKVAA
jgi:putative DNA primase/helicase